MKKIDSLTDLTRDHILRALYREEMTQAILIDVIEKSQEPIGALYISESEGEVSAILHIQDDGNSKYTSFYAETERDIKRIANQLERVCQPRQLLAGKADQVRRIFSYLGAEVGEEEDLWYCLNPEKYKPIQVAPILQLRLAQESEEDLAVIRKFTIAFFCAETAEEIQSVGDAEKIRSKIRSGLYLLERQGYPVGMARFGGRTRNFAEITSVYISPEFRGQGLGRVLMDQMIRVAFEDGVIPTLAVNGHNQAAIRLYESLGFEEKEKYAFVFLPDE